MPIYVFKCECGKTFDKLFSKPEPPRTEKCECGKDARKIITPVKFRCLGLGFAGNDLMTDKLYKEYSDIADNVYTKKAEFAQAAIPQSEKDLYYQNLAQAVGD